MKKTAFERYAPFIQEHIYRKKWTDLRQVQVEACEAIMDTDKHVIIASGTASGKTEAAFFPMLTLLEKNPSESIGIMYIGPLKALINDQFARLSSLLEEQDIPVWPWHGDISQSTKNRALKSCQGILQITPESFEALLMRHSGDARRLFSDLRFIVIDEIHSLMGEDRGLQVLCLIAKLERIIGCKPRRIGLSATLNDYEPAMKFLSSGSDVGSVAVGIQTHKRTISLCVENFSFPKNEEEYANVMDAYNNFLYNNCHTKKCLVFTNSRSTAEETISSMKSIARERNDRDIFYVHHGSVSAALRHEAEHALKENDGPTVAAATLTLELGIDIGDLDSTIQIGAPYSASSFVQRLGRSGRRTGKSQMLFVTQQEESRKNPYDALPWDLLRSIAIIQLYLEERWVEPFNQKAKPFSLLAHQTLSTLMACGELSPSELARKVLTLPPFKGKITTEEYKILLRYMLEREFLQRLENGGLIVGLKGESLTNHYSFYAVFQDEESYSVRSKDGEIGTLTKCPDIDEVFVLAGRAWRVTAIDEKRKIIFVNQTHSQNIPSWSGGGGDIHTKVVQRIKRVLIEDTVYPYLQSNAIQALNAARQLARDSGILEYDVLPIDSKNFFVAPWVGTKELRTISKLLSCGLKKSLEVFSVHSTQYYLQITSNLTVSEFLKTLSACRVRENDPSVVMSGKFAPRIDKYDFMVPDDLLKTAFLYNQMDVPYAMSTLKRIATKDIT